MQFRDLQFLPAGTNPEAHYVLIVEHRIMVWRHNDGNYTIRKYRKSGKECWSNLEPIFAQAVLHELTGSVAKPLDRPIELMAGC